MPADPWFLVCKPLREPFDDGSTVLVRDLVKSMPAERELSYFGDPALPLRPDDQPLPAAPMGHSPSMAAKMKVLAAIVHPGRRRAPLHFFFTPNPITSRVVAGLRTLQSSRPMVQSLMSSHEVERHVGALAPLDRVVVLSDDTRKRLVDAGMDARKVVRIHPAVSLPDAEPSGPVPKRMLYAGDLDRAVGRRLAALGAATSGGALEGWQLVIACRPKHAEDAEARAALRSALAEELEEGRVELHGRVDDMDALMRRCGVQVFVADHVERKVDLPLVLLEGLARGLPLLCLDFAPVNEIFARAKGHEQRVGAALPADPEALVAAVADFVGAESALLESRLHARRLVREEFSLEAMAKAYAELHDELSA